MNPLEQIRLGLEQKDFNLIATGYKLMTGKVVDMILKKQHKKSKRRKRV